MKERLCALLMAVMVLSVPLASRSQAPTTGGVLGVEISQWAEFPDNTAIRIPDSNFETAEITSWMYQNSTSLI